MSGAQPASIKMPARLEPLIGTARIARRVQQLAGEVHAALRHAHRPLAVVVLQGGFVFAADLLRALPPAFCIETNFMRVQSYGAATVSSGRVLLLQDIESDLNLAGRTVLLIDDILDTGRTLQFLMEHLQRRGAAQVLSCVLLRRTVLPAGRERIIEADFSGFDIKDEFAVGYGLDDAGIHRNLPFLAALKQEALQQDATDQKVAAKKTLLSQQRLARHATRTTRGS